MTLILPVIHPKIGGPGFSEPEWEIVSATKTAGTTFAEEDPLPLFPAQSYNFVTETSLQQHDGALIFRTLNQYASAAAPPTQPYGTYPTIFKKTNTGWIELCDEYSFTDTPETTIQNYKASFVWEGDIYMAVRLAPYIGGSYSALNERNQIYRWDSGTTWTRLTNTAHSVAPPLLYFPRNQFNHGVFFEFNTELHFGWVERFATFSNQLSTSWGTRFVVASWDGTAWTRQSERAYGGHTSNRWLETVEVSGDTAYIPEFANLYAYTVADGLKAALLSDSRSDFIKAPGDATSWEEYPTWRWHFSQFAGSPGYVFSRRVGSNYDDARNYFHTSRWVGPSQQFDLQQFNKPQAGTGATLQDYKQYGGNEYILIAGAGTGMANTEEGIWLYRRNGASWEVLGNADVNNGSLRPSTTKFGTSSLGYSGGDCHLFFLDGDPHVLYEETKSESGVEGRRLIIARYA